MPELDAYLKFFIMLPAHITKSLIVKEFFEAKLSDQEAEMEMVIEHQASGLGYYEDGPAAAMMRTDAQREYACALRAPNTKLIRTSNPLCSAADCVFVHKGAAGEGPSTAAQGATAGISGAQS